MIDQKEGETELSVKIHYNNMVSLLILSFTLQIVWNLGILRLIVLKRCLVDISSMRVYSLTRCIEEFYESKFADGIELAN